VHIDVDLGAGYAVSDANLRVATRTTWGIYYPPSVSVYTSADGSSWTAYGSPVALPTNPADGGPGTAIATVSGWVNARYVRFALSGTTAWTFVDEVWVNGSVVNTSKLVPTTKIYHGAYPSDAGGNLQIANFESISHRSLKMVLWYADWVTPFAGNVEGVIDGYLGGRYLEVGFLPSNATAAQIARGGYDAFLKQWFLALKAKNTPVWVRPMNEMNGCWTFAPPNNCNASSQLSYGGDPQSYRWAWRRMYNIAEQAGATGTNQIFLWSPDARAPTGSMSAYYPGDSYVDWVGVSAYGDAQHSLDSLLSEVDSLYGATKPLMISEGGDCESSQVDKAEWITAWFKTLYARQHFKAAVWFHRDSFAIDTSPATLDAYTPYFQGNW
jgi:hypothetical protein